MASMMDGVGECWRMLLLDPSVRPSVSLLASPSLPPSGDEGLDHGGLLLVLVLPHDELHDDQQEGQATALVFFVDREEEAEEKTCV